MLEQLLCFIKRCYPIRKIHSVRRVPNDVLSISRKAEHGCVRFHILLCCLSMSNAERTQISFTLSSSKAAMCSSASARAELKLLVFQHWTENFYVTLHCTQMYQIIVANFHCFRLHSNQQGRYDRFHALHVESLLLWFLRITNFHINCV